MVTKPPPKYIRYQAPPMLRGYNFPISLIKEARAKGRLLTMRLETSAACNLRCLYCNGVTGKKLPGEISFEEMKKAILQVKSLGGKSVVVIGGGEPTIYPHFKSLIRYINRKGMVPVVITNTVRMSRETAEFLYAEGASVLFKLDSLDERMQDYLSGKKGTHRRIREGMKNLLSVGFNKPQDGYLRCGASFVLTKINYKEIPALWRFCRDNRLYPNLEEFIPRNRGLKRMQEFWVDKKEVRRLKQELLKIDCAYGYDWLIYTPLSGHGCLQPLYSVYVACDGYVRPCADIDVRLFNIRDMDIPEIIKTPFFHFARNIEKHLQGRCYQCEHNYLCIGCRGNAFCVGTNEGLGVYEALCREDPLCWKRNPKKKPRAWN